jgi:hypothetical protein
VLKYKCGWNTLFFIFNLKPSNRIGNSNLK